MRLTKRKAVEITKELWEWCAETGESKWQWPKWRKYGEFHASCPLCEYAERHTGACSPCPLLGMWSDGSTMSRCMDFGSPFLMWKDTFDILEPSYNDMGLRKESAREIVDLCNRWLG